MFITGLMILVIYFLPLVNEGFWMESYARDFRVLKNSNDINWSGYNIMNRFIVQVWRKSNT